MVAKELDVYQSQENTDPLIRPVIIVDKQEEESESAKRKEPFNFAFAPQNVSQYLREINDIPRKTTEEQLTLAYTMRDGVDPKERDEAKRQLIECNLRYVVRWARRYSYNTLPLADLIQEGNKGLLIAADKFDPDRGFSFVNFATWDIRKEIIRAITRQIDVVSTSIDIKEKQQLYWATWERLAQELGKEPTDADVKKAMGETDENINHMRSLSLGPVSLDSQDSTNTDSDDQVDLTEKLADSYAEVEPETVATYKAQRHDVLNLLNGMKEKHRKIFYLYYGFLGNVAESFPKVGDFLGTSGENVRQIHNKVMVKVKANPSTQTLFSYLK